MFIQMRLYLGPAKHVAIRASAAQRFDGRLLDTRSEPTDGEVGRRVADTSSPDRRATPIGREVLLSRHNRGAERVGNASAFMRLSYDTS